MSSPILFLAYASNAAVPFNATTLVDLLAVSRRNNERVDVTGMLLYRGGNFLQALEGPSEAVRETIARISADTRHAGVDVLLEEEHDDRLFGEWSMAFEEVSQEQLDKHPGASSYLLQNAQESTAAAVDDHHVFEFFRSFRVNMR